MRKNILSILFVGLIFSGCSTGEKDLFKKIDEERKFRIRNYKEYVVEIDYDKKEDFAYIKYDLNKNGKSDAIAVTKIIKYKGYQYELEDFAFILSVNKDEEADYSTCYIDNDGDWKLETKIEKK